MKRLVPILILALACAGCATVKTSSVKPEAPQQAKAPSQACKIDRSLFLAAVKEQIPSYIREGKEMIYAACGEDVATIRHMVAKICSHTPAEAVEGGSEMKAEYAGLCRP